MRTYHEMAVKVCEVLNAGPSHVFDSGLMQAEETGVADPFIKDRVSRYYIATTDEPVGIDSIGVDDVDQPLFEGEYPFGWEFYVSNAGVFAADYHRHIMSIEMAYYEANKDTLNGVMRVPTTLKEALHFEKNPIPPDAMETIGAMIQRKLEAHQEKERLRIKSEAEDIKDARFRNMYLRDHGIKE